MAQTTGVIKGGDVILYKDGVAIAHSTNCDINITTNFIDITNKDSGGWKKILPDVKEWSISGSGMLAYDAAEGADDLIDAQLAGSSFVAKISTGNAGDTLLSGSVYVGSNSLKYPHGSQGEFDFNLEGNGELTKDVEV